MGIAHQGQVDLHEGHDLETVDLTQAYEESGSSLLETPLFGQVVETDSLMGHLLPGPVVVMRMHSLLVVMAIARV